MAGLTRSRIDISICRGSPAPCRHLTVTQQQQQQQQDGVQADNALTLYLTVATTDAGAAYPRALTLLELRASRLAPSSLEYLTHPPQ